MSFIEEINKINNDYCKTLNKHFADKCNVIINEISEIYGIDDIDGMNNIVRKHFEMPLTLDTSVASGSKPKRTPAKSTQAKKPSRVGARTCPYVFSRGEKAGQVCGKGVRSKDSICCSAHKSHNDKYAPQEVDYSDVEQENSQTDNIQEETVETINLKKFKDNPDMLYIKNTTFTADVDGKVTGKFRKDDDGNLIFSDINLNHIEEANKLDFDIIDFKDTNAYQTMLSNLEKYIDENNMTKIDIGDFHTSIMKFFTDKKFDFYKDLENSFEGLCKFLIDNNCILHEPLLEEEEEEEEVEELIEDVLDRIENNHNLDEELQEEYE